MDLGQVLRGRVDQQRVWTFGGAAGVGGAVTQPREPLPILNGVSFTGCSAGARGCGGPARACTCMAGASRVWWLHPEQAGMEGIHPGSCADACAGHRHSAAAADGGYVFVWGSNDLGQLGTAGDGTGVAAADACCHGSQGEPVQEPSPHAQDPSPQPPSPPQQPVATHDLDRYQAPGGAAAGPWRSPGPAGPSGHGMQAHTGSMHSLAASVKLPADLSAALWREECAAPACAIGEQGAASAVSSARSSRSTSGSSAGSHARHQQRQQEQLQVFRLRMPQPVQKVACGGAHTLVSLAGAGGLMAWGDNRHGEQ